MTEWFFHFARILFSRNFVKIKPSQNFPNLQLLQHFLAHQIRVSAVFTHLNKFYLKWRHCNVKVTSSCYVASQCIHIWAVTCDFQQCGILTSADSDEHEQPLFKLRNSKSCSVSSLTLMEYSSDEQRLWSPCMYAHAGLRLCWSHIPHCQKSHVTAHMWYKWYWMVRMKKNPIICVRMG